MECWAFNRRLRRARRSLLKNRNEMECAPRIARCAAIHHSITPSLHHSIPIMPEVPIIMPQLGESIAEATIVSVAVQAGDQVEADQDVMEVETNKAVMGVTTPCPGRVKKLLV